MTNDRRLAYMDALVRHITDRDLFESLDLDLPGLAGVKEAAAREDYPAAYRAWREYLRLREEAIFLKHPQQDTLLTPTDFKAACTGISGQVDRIVAAAQKVVEHEIRGWGEITAKFGPVIDFNHEFGNSGVYGFHYWGWAEPLVQAYVLTGDAAWAREFDQTFHQWYEQRDLVKARISGLDPIFYELGLMRTTRFATFYRLAKHEEFDSRTDERMLKTFLGAGRWLFELEGKGFRHGNWQYCGASTMAQIAFAFPEFVDAPQWVERGLRVLAEHADRDVYPDGCHHERSVGYGAMSYRLARDAAFLIDAARNLPQNRRLPFPDGDVGAIRSTAGRMLDWFLATLTPVGLVAPFNDENRSETTLGLLADGAIAHNTGQYLWPLARLGRPLPKGSVKPAPPPYTSVNLPDSRFAVMRSDWSARAHYMIVNYGPSGGGHSHRDMLDFELYAFGQALAIDSGIGTTYDDPGHIPWYVTARAHNMLVVEEANLDRRVADGEQAVWTTGVHLDALGAQHRGYEAEYGVTHRRNILFVKPLGDLPGYWLVTDTAVSAAVERRVAWYLHSPLPMEERSDGVIAGKPGGPGLLVLPSSRLPLRFGAGLAAVQGLGMGPEAHQEVPWLAFDATVHPGGALELAVLLAPFEDIAPAPGSIRLGLESAPGDGLNPPRCYRVHHPLGTDYLVVGDGRVHEFPRSEVATDARFALIRIRGGQVVAVVAARCTRLSFRGEMLIG